MLAIRSMNMSNPIRWTGITFAVNGNDDAYFIEGSDFAKYDAATSHGCKMAASIDLNGQSSNCSWTDDGCA